MFKVNIMKDSRWVIKCRFRNSWFECLTMTIIIWNETSHCKTRCHPEALEGWIQLTDAFVQHASRASPTESFGQHDKPFRSLIEMRCHLVNRNVALEFPFFALQTSSLKMEFIFDNVSRPYRWSHSSTIAKSGNQPENALNREHPFPFSFRRRCRRRMRSFSGVFFLRNLIRLPF